MYPTKCTLCLWFLLLAPASLPAQSEIRRERLAAIDDPQVRAEVEKLYLTDPFQRARGAERLRGLGPQAKAAIPWLIEALCDDEYEGDWDPTEKVSWYARRALVAIGDPAADALIETLQRREPLVRERAAKLLGDMKVQRAVGPLLAVLGRADVKQAWGTASALGDMKVKTAVGPLIELLEWDDSRTRARGAGALAYIGDARAIGPLSKLAVRDGGNDVAEAAVGALTQIPNGGMEAAIALLRHKNSRTRESAARSLAYVHDPRLIEPLLQAIRDPAIQDTAAQSLHWIVKYRGIDVALDAF
ncbi:MAG: HEAT repeat domain-containing protein, partial [Planctomycetota bacterium]